MRILLAAAIMIMLATPTLAAELMMIHSPTCGYCQAFMRDVEPTYNESEQGKSYPLKVVNVSIKEDRDWIFEQMSIHNIKSINGTPTFIIWIDGKEVNRFEGYGGKEWFYQQLDAIID